MKKARGIVKIFIPVGNLPPSAIPDYMREVLNNMGTDPIKEAGFMVYGFPCKERKDPDIEMIKF